MVHLSSVESERILATRNTKGCKMKGGVVGKTVDD
jgi:hypothetical protein